MADCKTNQTEQTQNAYAYMVRCEGGQLYAGWTNDPAARLHAHKTGKGAKSTRAFHAQGFAYLERCADRSAAMKREAELKRLTKAQKEALCVAWSEQNRPRLSVATRADAADIVTLYNWYVQNSTATFQITPSTAEEYEQWVEHSLECAPLLLARDAEGKLLGYACAHRWHEREAFDWDVESTVYCAPEARALGVGQVLYAALLELLKAQGYWNVYALIADPNPASERFHEKFGFTCEGRTPHTGYKMGHWVGLSTWHLALRTGRGAPQPVRKILTAEEIEAVIGEYA
jgi:L-amino acid N-acyltransferase YncA/predicted GIY-YIG superfamily endonuclease